MSTTDEIPEAIAPPMSEHTPLPWVAANNWIMRRHPTTDVRIAVCDAYTAPKQLSDARDRANAQLITVAVNNHEALVEALEVTARWQLPDGPCWCELKRSGKWETKLHSRGCKLARAALARVRQA